MKKRLIFCLLFLIALVQAWNEASEDNSNSQIVNTSPIIVEEYQILGLEYKTDYHHTLTASLHSNTHNS